MKIQVKKSILIDAPIKEVKNQVEDFKHWNNWSPWTVIEPDCPVDVSGTANASGHSMHWDGKIIGSGRNTIESVENQNINYDLEFFKPWKSKAKTRFLFDTQGKQTKVTWTMDSNLPFFMFFMASTIKNSIGMDYDRGLSMLKEVVENGQVHCKTNNKGIVDYTGFSYVGIQRNVAFSDMAQTMKKDFESIVNKVVHEHQKSAQHWVCLYPKFDIKRMQVTYIAAISDENLRDIDLGSDYIKGSIKSGKSLEITHDGSYNFLGNAWSMGMMNMRAQNIKGSDYPFEQYWNSPMEVKEEELKTSIYFPVKA